MKQLTRKELKEVLLYDKRTGLFTWKVTTGRRAIKGSVAGHLQTNGYIRITIRGKRYYAHRLAWLYVYGYFPENDIDHINRDGSINKISNLREATRSCNLRNSKLQTNNKTGVTGVCFCKTSDKFCAYISVKNKHISLGYFKTFGDAVMARWDAEVKYNYPDCNTTSSAYQYLQRGGGSV